METKTTNKKQKEKRFRSSFLDNVGRWKKMMFDSNLLLVKFFRLYETKQRIKKKKEKKKKKERKKD